MKQHLLVPVCILALFGAKPPVLAAEVASPVVPLVLVAEPPSDETLASNVLNAIRADEILRYEAGNVQVSVHNGIVTLSGTLHRNTIRQRMGQVAKAAKGVSQVVNLLTVDSK